MAKKDRATGQFTFRFDTDEKRRKLFNEYIDHLENGFSPASFKPIYHKQIDNYCEKFPEIFNLDKIEEAKRTGLLLWEKIGQQGVSGELKGFNVRAWISFMQNNHGWSDKTKETGVGTANTFILKMGGKEYKGDGEPIFEEESEAEEYTL